MQPFLPGLTGLLLVAAFPRADQGYIAWMAFVPLIVFVYRTKTIIRAFWGGFAAGALGYFGLLIWIPRVLEHYGEMSYALAWISYALMVAMLACYPATACAVSKVLTKYGRKEFLLLLPAVWVVLEYAQSHSPFGGFPWLLAGYSQSSYLNLIQVADLTGVYGISFLILWFGTALVWVGLHKGRAHSFWPLIAAGVLIVFCLAYGTFSLRRWGRAEAVFQAALLQGNLSANDSERILTEKFQQGYERLADSLKSPRTDLLVLPESPSPIMFQYDPDYRQTLEKLARRYSMGLIFNNIRSAEIEGNDRYLNSAYFLDGKGMLVGIYDKIHLVPFGEYIPLKTVFSFAETVSKDVGGFYPGHIYSVFPLGKHKANAIICFEAVFPGLVRRFVQEGSQLLINLTNDEWYGDSAAPYQHLAIARWRAVENRRYLLRAANSGISAFIEPTGRIQTSTGILQEAVCEGRFAFLKQRTPYTCYGDAFVFACAIIDIGFLMTAFMSGSANTKIMNRRLRRIINARRTS